MRFFLNTIISQINPEHTVPTLVDDGNSIWDSQAICAYLVDKYGGAEHDKLYPKDLVLRARCNQRLFFNASSLFVRLRDCSVAIFWKGATEVSQEKLDPIRSAFDLLEVFLVKDPYLVGNGWTIADISVANTVSMLGVYVPIKNNIHPKIAAWLDRLNKNIPHFKEINADWVDQYKQLITLRMDQSKSQKK